MRGISPKTALITLVTVLGSVGCGGPLEEEGTFEEQDGVTREETGEVSALKRDDSSPCENVRVGPRMFWAPSHKLYPVKLSGAKDITITSVKQDEPLNDRGDDRASPDAAKVEDRKDVVFLRAEPNSQGDGRVYCISFTARDASGATCTGMVTVGIPNGRGRHWEPINSGCRYDSLGD